ncbi:hypothetical protein MRX96_008704 [Rhipicephalus microplus]
MNARRFPAHNYPTCLDSELMALRDTLDAGLRYLGRERPIPAGVEFPELEPRGDGVPLRREQVDPEEGECEPSSEALEDRRFSRMTLQVSCRDRKCSRVSQPPPTRIMTCFSLSSCDQVDTRH